MALTPENLCSKALVRIGAQPIISFEDGSAEAEIAGVIYASTRDALLSDFAWSFATAQAQLVELADAPTADFRHAYQLPTGLLRVLSAGTGGRGRGVQYRIAGGSIEADASPLVLTYIFRPEEAAFPPFFDAALVAHLAAELCIPVTENTSRAEMLMRLAESEFRKAKLTDSQQDTPLAIDDFSLINARR